MKGIFTSRKFWAALLASLGVIGTVFSGTVTWPEAVNAIIAIWSAYIVGTGIASAVRK